ncbi:MAG: hypothetical protein AB7P04_14450 [Bacteriovoracia bacterium]
MTRTRTRTWLSVFIVFHLAVVLLIPNESSYLTQYFRPLIAPYATTLGLARAWQFFSPDPGPSVYLEYIAMKDGTKLDAGFFPPLQNPFWLRDPYNRRTAALRMTFKVPDYVQTVVVPYLCRQYPAATLMNVSLWIGGPPSLEEVEKGGSLRDHSRREMLKTDVVFCDPAKNPVKGAP